MFRDLPIVDALQHVASKEEWAAYEHVRDVEPPPLFDDGYPGQREAFTLRRELEPPLLERARRKLEGGQWEAVGRFQNGPRLEPIEPRLWPQLEFELHFGRVVFVRSKDKFFSNLIVSVVRPASQGEKQQLRGELTKWFDDQEAVGAPPQGRSKWLALAKARFPELTDNMFNQVWRAMGHPHPLKLDGRPHE